MKYAALAITVSLALTACGNGDGHSSNNAAAPILASVSGIYKSSDGNTTLDFNAGKVHLTNKIGKGGEYQYTIEGKSIRWTYEATGVPESCEIKSSTEIFCSAATTTFTKIN